MLRRSQNNYAYGEYSLAITLVEKALSEEVSLSSEERIAARELLRLEQLSGKGSRQSTDCLHRPLLQAPKHVLDPFSVAPPIIEFFEAIRRELNLSSRLLHRRSRRPSRSKSLTLVVSAHKSSNASSSSGAPWTLYALWVWPISERRHNARTYTAGVQLTALAVNIGAYYLARSYRRDPELGRMFSQLQYGGLAFFGLSWSAGVVQARLNFVPRVVRPPIIRQARGGSEDKTMIEAHATLTLTTW